MNPNDTSRTLLMQVKANDPVAWDQFLSIYQPLVRYWCRRQQGLSDEDTADVVQEVFLSVSRSIGQFRHERKEDTLRGWLRVITANRIRNLIQKKSRAAVAAGGSTAHLRMNAVADGILAGHDDEKECGIILRTALEVMHSNFEEATYEAFWLMAIEGRATDDIAAQLNTTPQAVRQSCYRVRRRLRKELGEILE